MFHLSYKKGDGLHGSGLSFTRADFMEMDVAEIDFHLETLGDQREEEAKKIKSKNTS